MLFILFKSFFYYLWNFCTRHLRTVYIQAERATLAHCESIQVQLCRDIFLRWPVKHTITMTGFGANKAIITLRPGFGPLQATVLHQLKGEKHVMNLQVKKKPPYCDTLKYKERHALKKMITPNWTIDGPKAVISEIHTQALDIKRKLHITPLIRFLCRGRLQMHPGATCPFGRGRACWMWPRWAACALGWLSTPPPLNDTQHSTPGWLSYWSTLTADAQLIYTFWSKFSGVRKKL